jgi:hypothetical protein
MDIFRIVHAVVCVLVLLFAAANLIRGARKGVVGFYGEGFDRRVMPVTFAALFIAYVIMVAAAGYWGYLDITQILHAQMR